MLAGRERADDRDLLPALAQGENIAFILEQDDRFLRHLARERQRCPGAAARGFALPVPALVLLHRDDHRNRERHACDAAPELRCPSARCAEPLHVDLRKHMSQARPLEYIPSNVLRMRPPHRVTLA